MVEATPFSNSAIAMRKPMASFLAIENVLQRASLEGSDERRLTKRYQIEEPVTIQPLDSNFYPSGFELTALARSISHCGIGLTTVQPIRADYLRVTFDSCSSESDHSVVIKIKHQTARGATYVVGGQLEIDWRISQDDEMMVHRLDSPAYKLALMLNIRRLLSE